MGRRGPISEPTALKVARGVRADRINPDEPRPPLCPVPDPPETLEPEALAHWRRLAPQLHAAQLLTELDVDLLAIYCELVVTKDAARELLRAGVLTRGRAGELVTNPAWRIYRDAVDRLRLLAHELGMSPSARSTIRLLPPSIGGDVKSDAP